MGRRGGGGGQRRGRGGRGGGRGGGEEGVSDKIQNSKCWTHVSVISANLHSKEHEGSENQHGQFIQQLFVYMHVQLSVYVHVCMCICVKGGRGKFI